MLCRHPSRYFPEALSWENGSLEVREFAQGSHASKRQSWDLNQALCGSGTQVLIIASLFVPLTGWLPRELTVCLQGSGLGLLLSHPELLQF